MTLSRADLTIDELLDDPMTRAVMKADGVDPSALEAMLRALTPRTAPTAGRASRNLCAAVASRMRLQLCGAP